MKLNINSKTSRLYRWFYATSNMPQSLCPYFWKLVLMWTLIIPYTILSLPTILMDRKDPEFRTTGERAAVGFFAWFILGMIVSMLSYVGLIWATPTKDSFFMFALTIGSVCWVFAIAIGIYQGIQYLKKKWENQGIKYNANGYRIWDEPVEKQPNIIVEFVKASYNKYCPRIEWTYNKQNK